MPNPFSNLRGGADSVPLGAPPRILCVVVPASPGCGASTVAAAIADAAAGLITGIGTIPTVALLYPRDDDRGADLKNGVTERFMTEGGCTRGNRRSGSVLVVPVPESEHAPEDTATWFHEAGNPEIVVVDAADVADAAKWADTGAAATAVVMAARSSVPSISAAAAALDELSMFSTGRIAIAAASSDSPPLVELTLGQAHAGSAAYFPFEDDMAVIGVPAELSDGQLVVARDLLTRLNVMADPARDLQGAS